MQSLNAVFARNKKREKKKICSIYHDLNHFLSHFILPSYNLFVIFLNRILHLNYFFLSDDCKMEVLIEIKILLWLWLKLRRA